MENQTKGNKTQFTLEKKGMSGQVDLNKIVSHTKPAETPKTKEENSHKT